MRGGEGGRFLIEKGGVNESEGGGIRGVTEALYGLALAYEKIDREHR
jgi:hypothetical protein